MRTRFNLLMAATMAVVVVVDLLLARIERLGGVVERLGLFGELCLGPVALYLFLSFPGWRRLDGLRQVSSLAFWSLLGNASLTVLILLAGRSDAPLVDGSLARIDHALFFSSGEVVRWTSAHPWAFKATWLLYPALTPFFIVPIFLLPLTGRSAAARRYVLSITIAAVLTAGIFALLPAVGPWTVFGFKPTPEQELCQKYLAEGLKSSGRAPIAYGMSAVVSFPSFHTVMALMAAIALWGIPYIRIAGLLLAIGICISTMTSGWHYLIDVLGGIALTGISHWIADLFLRPEFPKSITSGTQ